MSTKLLRITRLITPSRPATPILTTHLHRTFTTAKKMSAPAIVDSNFISQITQAEKLLTQQDNPVSGGPTTRAESHQGHEITSQVIHDITMGERIITGLDAPVKDGPTSVAQHLLAQASRHTIEMAQHSGVVDADTLSKITAAEKEITGEDRPVRRGPTAKAQQHVGEPITSEVLSDITQGEKKITGGERVKGGPTATAQSELLKSRS